MSSDATQGVLFGDASTDAWYYAPAVSAAGALGDGGEDGLVDDLIAAAEEDEPCPVRIRPYQQSALDAYVASLKRGEPCGLFVLPTGTGKTVLFGFAAREAWQQGKRVLILAHRGKLLDQAIEKLEGMGVPCTREQAGDYAHRLPDARGRYPVVVATVQSMQGRRLKTWEPATFDLVIVDEAHHAISDQYQATLAWLRPRYVKMVTATPDPLKGEGIADTITYEYRIFDAFDDGYLATPTMRSIDVGVDLRQLRVRAGDFNQGDLEDVLRPHIEPLANKIVDHGAGQKGIAFLPTVASAEAMASALRSLGLRAEATSGDDAQQDQILDRFAAMTRDAAGRLVPNSDERMLRKYGKPMIDVLCNCALLTEGYDEPSIRWVAILRPTKSRVLYTQMFGRGTRLFTDPVTGEVKTRFLLLDLACISDKHSLAHPVDLLADAAGLSEEERKIAKWLLDTGRQEDVLGALEEAKRERERREKERERLERERQEQQARERERLRLPKDKLHCPVRRREVAELVRYDYSIEGAKNVVGVDFTKENPFQKRPATDAQKAYLDKCGVKDLDKFTLKSAGRLISELKRRRELGLATFKQLTCLLKAGIPEPRAREMTFAAASDYLDGIFGRKTGRRPA